MFPSFKCAFFFINASYCSESTHTLLSGTAPQEKPADFCKAMVLRTVICTATKTVAWPCEAGKLPWYGSSLGPHSSRRDAGWQLQWNSYHSHLLLPPQMCERCMPEGWKGKAANSDSWTPLWGGKNVTASALQCEWLPLTVNLARSKHSETCTSWSQHLQTIEAAVEQMNLKHKANCSVVTDGSGSGLSSVLGPSGTVAQLLCLGLLWTRVARNNGQNFACVLST